MKEEEEDDDETILSVFFDEIVNLIAFDGIKVFLTHQKNESTQLIALLNGRK